jgi:hypothetical protein
MLISFTLPFFIILLIVVVSMVFWEGLPSSIIEFIVSDELNPDTTVAISL